MGLLKRKKKISYDEQRINTNRLRFYQEIQKFFDRGLLKEIYKSDMVSICNLANSFYLVFHFAFDADGTFFGVITESTTAKNIVQDNNAAIELLEYYIQSDQKRYVVPLNDSLIKYFLPIKAQREKEGSISENIDLEFESEMIKRKNEGL